ncbi:MAG: DUF4112 domain-containing protein [Candidatus Hydrogenedentes bacterium]|nr:DUF4112 domain-containing protein [Candidatus Hydrogenedentota bacterium]
MAGKLTHAQREKLLLDLRKLAWLMDYSIRIPGTRFRFGLDPLLGLLPGLGDALGMLISIYLILQAQRLGFSRGTLTQMVTIVLLDALLGAIPVLGDVFDFVYKANRRNLVLLHIEPDYSQ